MKNRLMAIFGSCVFILLFCMCEGGKDTGNAAAKAEYSVQKKNLRDAVTMLGLLEPKSQVEIRSEVSGSVTRIFVQEGAYLRAGSPILLVDPRPYENEKEKLLLQRRKLELEYAIQQREWSKDSLLDAQGAVSSRQIQDQRDLLLLKKLRLEEVDIDIKNINEKLEKTTLVSPINGTLLGLNTKVGEIVVSATTGYSAGSNIGILANTDSMQVTCYINEVDYQAISKETPVNVFLSTDQGVCAKGRIAHISKFAKPQEGKPTRNFEVKVDVYDIPKRMAPGINVTVEFVVLDKKDVMALPCSCIKQKGADKGIVMLKSTDSSAKECEVKLGATDYKFTEILGGLNSGDVVLEL